ncbi:MAG: TetR/AcrR family transcriptional regulator [Parvibaculum sp.]|nr:TetR/AcrR family transcriptional regulator [Parvibaculum sp.]
MAEKALIPAKTRGRPKSYDPDRALWAALEQFWAGGYAATSLDELAASTGMNRPSLYAAFGDKKALYLKTLTRFSAELRAALGRDLYAKDDMAAALEQFYAGALDFYLTGPDGPRGCFAICTATAEAANDAEIRAALEIILKEIDEGLEARLRHAQSLGQIDADADTSALAKVAAATLHSLAVRARAGESRETLEKLASQTAQLIAPKRKENKGK